MRLLAACLPLLLLPPLPASAQDDDWVVRKCAIYAEAWTQADKSGLGEAFTAGNAAFIASACTDKGEICPVSAAELDLANNLTLVLMNAGAASTFLPFACAHPAPKAGGWTGPGL